MSKKKLAGIIVACTIAISAAIVVAIHSPLTKPDETVKPEYVAVSAYGFAAELFDPQLTALQRESLWGTYEGKQVRWINELEAVAAGEEQGVAWFRNPLDWKRTRVEATFDESQRADLAELREGGLVIYTGILAGFEEAEIRLRDCTIVSLALAPLWWNNEIDTSNKRILVGDEVLCLGPSTYKDATEYDLPKTTAMNRQTGELLWEGKEAKTILMGIDSHYIYTCWLTMNSLGIGGVLVHPTVEAVDKVSGQIVWTSSLPVIPLSLPWCREYLREILGREATLDDCLGFWTVVFVIDEITNKAESSLILLPYRLPLSELAFSYEGVIYRSACAIYGGVGRGCAALQAIDQETGRVLWMTTFQEKGMNDFSVVDGILYVSTDRGVGAFKL